MEQNYKRHLIIVVALCNQDGKWKPNVQIADFSQGDRFHINSATFSKKYVTEEETEQAGVSFAKQWIDKGKLAPGLRLMQINPGGYFRNLLQKPHRPLCHLHGLRGRLVKPRLKLSPAMVPSMSIPDSHLPARTMNFDGLRGRHGCGSSLRRPSPRPARK
jgi:hypothetical protein